MRKSLPLSLVVALALSACGGEPSPSSSSTPAAAAPVAAAPVTGPALRGSIAVKDIARLPAGIQLNLKLLDITDPASLPVVVAESTQPAPNALPADVALGYDPARIDQTHRYALQASLKAETVVLYGSAEPFQVLTQGAPSSGIAMELVRGGQPAINVPPADKLKLDFAKLESEIGALRRIKGERLEEEIAVGWDAFVDSSGQIRMAREQVDYGDAGSAAFRYAYQSGLPWVVERKQGGVKTLVGWNADGQVVLNEQGDAPATDEELAALRQRAADLYQTAAAQR